MEQKQKKKYNDNAIWYINIMLIVFACSFSVFFRFIQIVFLFIFQPFSFLVYFILLRAFVHELDMGPYCWPNQSNPIQSLHKYLASNRTRKLRATYYSNAEF